MTVTVNKMVLLKNVWAVLHTNLSDTNLRSCTGCLATYTSEQDANRAILDNKRLDVTELYEATPEIFTRHPNDLSDSEVEGLWEELCFHTDFYKVERVGVFHLHVVEPQ